jgi:hypothetical protein
VGNPPTPFQHRLLAGFHPMPFQHRLLAGFPPMPFQHRLLAGFPPMPFPGREVFPFIKGTEKSFTYIVHIHTMLTLLRYVGLVRVLKQHSAVPPKTSDIARRVFSARVACIPYGYIATTLQ